MTVDRYWLLTWTTYGTWLPGDERGFVGPLDDRKGGWVIHNVPGTPYDSDIKGIRKYSANILKCPPIFLNEEQALAIAEQFHETARIRKWELIAFAIISNHVHLVVGVPGDPEPETILRDFKAYASGRLNKRWKKPKSETWWTESGSKRKLVDEPSLLGAVRYVMQQESPLVDWIASKYLELLGSGERPA
jgi:REP element-mobilizing transposase RayT